jgi:hypothetical protein
MPGLAPGVLQPWKHGIDVSFVIGHPMENFPGNLKFHLRLLWSEP